MIQVSKSAVQRQLNTMAVAAKTAHGSGLREAFEAQLHRYVGAVNLALELELISEAEWLRRLSGRRASEETQ